MAELTPYQLDIITRTILGEARGEGADGMAAVAHNIRNRALSGQFPSDPAQVALQPYQYSTWNKGEGGNNPQQFSTSSSQYKNAREVVQEVFGGQRPDPTNGALFYHTPQVNPKWAGEVNRYGTTKIGNHIFYNGRPVPPGEVPNAVATARDTRRPAVAPSMPTPATQRPPQIPFTTATTANNRAAQAAPTYAVTPRLATQDGGIFNYRDREMMPSQFPGGFASLTPEMSRRVPLSEIPSRAPTQVQAPAPAPARLPPLPQTARDTAPRPTPNAMRNDTGQSLNVMLAAAPPPMAPARNSMIDTSMQRAAAAVDPGLQRALAAAAGPRPTGSGLSRDSVQMAQAGNNAVRALGPTAFAQPTAPVPVMAVPSALPGPTRIAQDQSRLAPNGWGTPQVATALDVLPPITTSPPLPRARPNLPITGFPTPLGATQVAQRAAPVRAAPARAIFGFPTQNARRPLPPNALNVVVQGAGTIQPAVMGGGGTTRINPANHDPAQLAALAAGQSTFTPTGGGASEPVRAMNGRIRNTY